ncbi:MAG: (Fe-S)-binding protein [bacterium]
MATPRTNCRACGFRSCLAFANFAATKPMRNQSARSFPSSSIL